MRKIIIVLVLFLGIALIILSLGELEDTLATLQRANPWFLTLALLIYLGWMVNLGLTFQSIYRLLGLREDLMRLILLAEAAGFVNVVAPSVGVGGIAVFVANAKPRGHPPGKVTAAGALYLLFDQTAFLAVLTLGLIVLIRRNNLQASEVIASLILLGVAGVLAGLLYLGSRSAQRLGNALARGARLVNRLLRPFLRREYLSEARAHSFAVEIGEGLAALRGRRHSLVRPLLLSLLNKALLIGVLLMSFLSFDVPFSAGTIVGGFAIGYLFMLISPTPSGIGVVEGAMALGLNSLRVAWEAAVVITLTYRAFTFWLPLGAGALAFRWLHLNAKGESSR